MNDLFLGLLGALLSTNPPAAAQQWVAQAVGVKIAQPAQDPVEQEYQAIMAEDDAARAEVDQWIMEKTESADEPEGEARRAVFRARVRERLEAVRKRYDDFIQKHPKHSGIRLAYGSFLSETGEEEAGRDQWEKARELDPSNPAAWNNLANYYGHNSPVTKAFDYYQKAIELDPTESVYYYNFATTVYLFRRDATNHFDISEEEVFKKAMALYHQALSLDPTNFVLATDVAQSYYGIKQFYRYQMTEPAQAEALAKMEQELSDKAIAEWEAVLKLARDQTEQQGVYLHLARNHIDAGRFGEAENYLGQVADQMFLPTKRALQRKIQRLQTPGEKPKADQPTPAEKPVNAPM